MGLGEDSASVTWLSVWPVEQERVCWGLVRRRHNQKLGLQSPHGRSCLLTVTFQQAVGNRDRPWAWSGGRGLVSCLLSHGATPDCLLLPFPLGLISQRTCLSCSAQPLHPAGMLGPRSPEEEVTVPRAVEGVRPGSGSPSRPGLDSYARRNVGRH